jgi:Asp-tRNA(Asn)/Glu-tRNA(Gln) amidotransferase A subunit family amidase
MPVGVQLVGAPGAEDVLLAAGLAVQRALMPSWAGPTRTFSKDFV